MVAGVDVSSKSTEGRCFQGNGKGVVARKSRTENHRTYAGVFIEKSLATAGVTLHTGCPTRLCPHGTMALYTLDSVGAAGTHSRVGGGDAGAVCDPVS